MPVNRWWAKSAAEIYWLEITGRPDLGADLKAPQQDETGDDYWSYSLINEVGDGDIVFHYDRNRHAIVAWSRAAGQAWEEDIVWAARGGSARRTSTLPHLRPGWKLGLTDHERLAEPVTLDQVRTQRTRVLDIEDRLTSTYGAPVYMPFVRYGPTMRAQQGYLTKMPAALLTMFPSLASAAQRARETAPNRKIPHLLSGAHRRAVDSVPLTDQRMSK